MKIKTNIFFWGGGVWSGGGGHGKCEQRSEVFVKIQKYMRRGSRMGGGRVGGVRGVRVDVNEELKFLRKFAQKTGGGGVGGLFGGVRGDVNEELKFFVKIQKKK